ncbi:hypothetical protein D1AOALGA4SA_2486 [Olavius algarvensis Delta 1 endosymbiont]|nr:hypothetical protein D1AOALGA4SA_2486 [Olavius algarvensis Delta 1 endosymbiont]
MLILAKLGSVLRSNPQQKINSGSHPRSWARSETIGYAVNPAARGRGMMEYWKVGMQGLVERDLFL